MLNNSINATFCRKQIVWSKSNQDPGFDSISQLFSTVSFFKPSQISQITLALIEKRFRHNHNLPTLMQLLLCFYESKWNDVNVRSASKQNNNQHCIVGMSYKTDPNPAPALWWWWWCTEMKKWCDIKHHIHCNGKKAK